MVGNLKEELHIFWNGTTLSRNPKCLEFYLWFVFGRHTVRLSAARQLCCLSNSFYCSTDSQEETGKVTS